MIKNYFKIAWRNLLRNKVFSLINIAGISIGLTCCLLLTLYIEYQLSFDKFNSKAERIVRVIMQYDIGGEVSKGNFTSAYVLPSFKSKFPEIESGVRMSPATKVVKYENKIINQKDFLYADPALFKIFDFKLLGGDPNQVLKNPKTLVLTQTTARKYFGDQDPIGKTLMIGDKQIPYTVSGIVADCPANSQIRFSVVASFASLVPEIENTYFDANYITYFLLKDIRSIASLQQKIPPFMEREMKGTGATITYDLEPLTTIHLHSPYDAMVPNLDISYIYIIGGIALLILAIACFTYINMSTACASWRAKEVGVRKVNGAYRSQIFWQFISESFILTLMSVLLGYVAAVFLLPSFNFVAGTSFTASDIFQPGVLIVSLFLLFIIAFLAGSYPALLLSGLKEIVVLKGSFKNSSSGILLRKTLTVFQFSISVFLIIATTVMLNQLHFIQNKKLGYDREHIIVIDEITQNTFKRMDMVKAELLSDKNVLSVSNAALTPVEINSGFSIGTTRNDQQSIKGNKIDEDFLMTAGMELIAGENITKQDIKDASRDSGAYFHYILNESAVKAFGWTPREAIGKRMYLMGEHPGEVKGVVKDFNFASLHNPVAPLVMMALNHQVGLLLIKTSGRELPQTIGFIENKFKSWQPQIPFGYHFLDEDYNNLYRSEMTYGKVLSIFSFIAIMLACMGLFGLSAFMIRQRVKEISVRKVLGASVPGITILISKDFLKLVIIAMLVASPIAWWAMNKWLQGFVYRINISWQVFAIAGVVALLIALLTVSFQAIKAAIANPVKNLRTE